jgi:hypothetical protein
LLPQDLGYAEHAVEHPVTVALTLIMLLRGSVIFLLRASSLSLDDGTTGKQQAIYGVRS